MLGRLDQAIGPDARRVPGAESAAGDVIEITPVPWAIATLVTFAVAAGAV